MTKLDRTTPPPVRSFDRLTIPEPRRVTLDNGVRLVILDYGEQPIVRLSVVRNGGLCEAPSHAVANLMPELLRDGAGEYTSDRIADLIDFNGAWIKSNPTAHYTSFVVHSLNSRFADIFPIVTDMILRPRFDAEPFDAARQKAAARMDINLRKVNYLAGVEMNRLVMGDDHPLACTDTPESIMEVTREEVVGWYRKGLSSENFTVFLAGRITPEIERMVTDGFATFPTGRFLELDYRPFVAQPTREATVRVADALQSAVKVAIPTIDRSHPDYIPLRLVVTTLGGYFGSRLMMNLREDKGYCYTVGAGLLGYNRNGIVDITTECDNRYVGGAIEEIQREIERMKDPSSYSPDELSRVKSSVMTSLASTLDTPFQMMDYYENQLINDIPADYFDMQQRAVAEASPESLSAIAAHYLTTDRIYRVIAGNPPN